MATTLAGKVSWFSAPVIYFDFSYDYQRVGTDMQYRIGVTCRPVTGQSYFGYPIYLSIGLDGTEAISGYRLKSASPSQWTSAITYTSDWLTVSGKSSGSTELTVRLYSGSGSTRNSTYTYSLYVSPAASSLTAANGTLGTAQTVTFTRYNSAYTHTLTYRCGTVSGTLLTRSTATSYSWTPPITWAAQATKSTLVQATLTLETFSGTTSLGSVSKTVSLAIPASVVPTIGDISIAGVSLWSENYIQGKSKATITLSGVNGVQGSTITAYRISGGGHSYTGSVVSVSPDLTLSYTTGILSQSGENKFICTVTDSRGRVASAEISISVHAYAPPVISSASVERAVSDGTINVNGTCLSVLAEVIHTANVGSENPLTLTAAYRVKGTLSWTGSTEITPGTRQVFGGDNVDVSSMYEVRLQATDGIGSIAELILEVGTAQFVTVWDYGTWGINQYPKGPGGWIKGDMTVDGKVTATQFSGDLDGRAKNADDADNAEHAKSADRAASADSAAKATSDPRGNAITGYIRSVSKPDANTLRFTRGDSTYTDLSAAQTVPRRIALHADGLLPTIFWHSDLSGYEYTPKGGEILIVPDGNAIYRYQTFSGAYARVYCYQPRRNGVTVTKGGEYVGQIMGNFTGYSKNTVPVTGGGRTLDEIGRDNFSNDNNSLFRGSPFALVASFLMANPWSSSNAVHDYLIANRGSFPLVKIESGNHIDDMVVIIRAYAKLPNQSGASQVKVNMVDNGLVVFRSTAKIFDFWAADCWNDNANLALYGSDYNEDGSGKTWTVYQAEQGGGAGFYWNINQNGTERNLGNYIQSSQDGEWVYEAPISDTYWNTIVEASSDAVTAVSGNNSLSYQTLDLYAKPGDYHIRTPASILSLGNLQVWRCKYARYGQDKQVWEKLF